jgi:hypothetical protein
MEGVTDTEVVTVMDWVMEMVLVTETVMDVDWMPVKVDRPVGTVLVGEVEMDGEATRDAEGRGEKV